MTIFFYKKLIGSFSALREIFSKVILFEQRVPPSFPGFRMSISSDIFRHFKVDKILTKACFAYLRNLFFSQRMFFCFFLSDKRLYV